MLEIWCKVTFSYIWIHRTAVLANQNKPTNRAAMEVYAQAQHKPCMMGLVQIKRYSILKLVLLRLPAPVFIQRHPSTTLLLRCTYSVTWKNELAHAWLNSMKWMHTERSILVRWILVFSGCRIIRFCLGRYGVPLLAPRCHRWTSLALYLYYKNWNIWKKISSKLGPPYPSQKSYLSGQKFWPKEVESHFL